MKHYHLIIAALFILLSCGRNAVQGTETEETPSRQLPPEGFFTEDFHCENHTVRPGENFISFLCRLGMEQDKAYTLSCMCDSIFDVRKLRSGNSCKAYYQLDTSAIDSTVTKTPGYFVYENDKVNRTVFKCTDSLAVWKYSRPISNERKFADITINSSLWNDMRDAGAPIELILTLSDIYAWTVDFFALQKQDRFRVIYNQRVCDGEVLAVDSVYFAVYTHEGKDFPAVLFDQGDGGNLYWNPEGESMRRAFLKAPLEFKRISSGFSYSRRHPVTGKVRPHTGVDYAAKAGTPVVAIGDGTVIAASYGACGKAGGNAVKIRHNSVYTTAYLHLSRYGQGIKSGTRVRQGQVIGYVGSTGSSTGPHLDFRVWKNGSAINPLKMESPPTEPLRKEFKPAFDSLCIRLRKQLDSLCS